ncbi:hypothetical protein [Asanoa siamensis]|uniref:hypothetical protein n=1 Tax=Asanoa siamensis TaxID=926357 RepID=UPI0019409FE0|nr:hypothetical protein [Asanoa siamensis]
MKTLAVTLVLAALGVAAVVYGSSDDAPGLVVIGLLLVLGGLAVGGRALVRHWRAAGRP